MVAFPEVLSTFFQESDSWYRLCEKVSDRCYIIGDYVNCRPGLLKAEVLSDGCLTSAVMLKLEQMNTISDIISGAQKYSGTYKCNLAVGHTGWWGDLPRYLRNRRHNFCAIDPIRADMFYYSVHIVN